MEAVVISGNRKNLFFSAADLKELWFYRDLLYLLVLRDVKVLYKQSIIGFGWAIIRPVLETIIFTVFFGSMAGIENQLDEGIPYPLFAFVALTAWNYFGTSLTGSTSSLINNANFLTKVYFPRLIIPLTPVIAKLVDFVIAFAILIGLLVYYQVPMTMNLLLLPLVIFMMMSCALGMSLWLSSLAIQYRDIHQMIGFIVNILKFLTPIIWPISYIVGNEGIPEAFQIAYQFFPMVGIIEGFRAAMLGTPIPWEMMAYGAFTIVFLLITGMMFFRNREAIFADVA
jgi:lipopolysaccharide transport system permease protein